MGPNTKTVVLAKPADWEAWIFIVRSLAEGENIWELIDPDLETEPVIPTEPTFPTPTVPLCHAISGATIRLAEPQRDW
jgi:hypothetical protein